MLVTEVELLDAMLESARGFTAGSEQARPRALELGPDRLWEVLGARRTVLAFSGDELAVEVLSGLLVSSGLLPSASVAAAGPAAAIAVALSGRDRTGLYLASGPNPDSWRWIGGQALVDELHSEFMQAPVIVFCLGRAAVAEEYFSSLISAGATGYDLWLAAVAQGIGAHPYGRPSAQVGGALAEVGRGDLRHLFTLALGWPDATEREENR